MGLETHAIVEIKERFHKENRVTPNMWWEYGTLWIDTNETKDIHIIKDVMETEVLTTGYKTSFNMLEATKTEPWHHWAMDIVEA